MEYQEGVEVRLIQKSQNSVRQFNNYKGLGLGPSPNPRTQTWTP